jgi:hypothetical protein
MNCPKCSTPGLEVTDDGTIDCPNCGILQTGRLKLCPACGHENPFNAESCIVCDEPLTIVSQIMIMQSDHNQPFRLKQVRSQASAIKEREERASQHRMEAFQEIDRRREQALAEAQEAQKVYQRRVSTVMFIIAGLFVIFVALFIAISLLR